MADAKKPTIERMGSLTEIRKANKEVLMRIKKPLSGGVLLMLPNGQWMALTLPEAQALSEALK